MGQYITITINNTNIKCLNFHIQTPSVSKVVWETLQDKFQDFIEIIRD